MEDTKKLIDKILSGEVKEEDLDSKTRKKIVDLYRKEIDDMREEIKSLKKETAVYKEQTERLKRFNEMIEKIVQE